MGASADSAPGFSFLSVCSGIEAASVAWAPLGWRPWGFAEIEPFPCALLAHHYPDVPNFGDMTHFQDWPDGRFDLLCGGTPCQSFSVAGLRKGLADPRGNLALTYLGIADRYRPRWLVWENVPGVLSSDGGRDFGALVGAMGELGYGVAWRVLDAQYVRVDGYGRAVPQRRRRVFLAGYLGDWRPAAAVFFEPESLYGHPAPSREAGQASPTLPSRNSAGGGLGTDFDCDGGLVAGFGGGNTSGPVDIAACLTAKGVRQDFEVETFVAHSLRAEGFDASEDGTGRGTPLVPICFSAKDHGGDAMEGLASTLRAGGHAGSHANAGGLPAVAFAQNGRDEVRAEGGDGLTVGALNRGGCKPGQGYPAIIQSGVRRLTPRECERLMGFPDDYTLIPYGRNRKWVSESLGDDGVAVDMGPGMAADGPRYKALGNSWAVNCARWVGRRIQLVDEVMAELAAERAA